MPCPYCDAIEKCLLHNGKSFWLDCDATETATPQELLDAAVSRLKAELKKKPAIN